MESMILHALKEIVSDNCSVIAIVDQCDGFGMAMGSFIFTFKNGNDSLSYEIPSVPMTEGLGETIKIIIDRLIKEILNKHFSESVIFKDSYNFLIKDN